MAEPRRRQLVLASASPFRRRMLEAAGLTFQVVAGRCRRGRDQARSARVRRDAAGDRRDVGRAKAEAVSARLPDALVIGADQVLALGEELFDKPADASEAREQLLRLRGKTHHLHTAAALARGGKAVWSRVEIATLPMRPFSEAFLTDYLAEVGDRVCQHRRRLRDRGPRHPAVRAHRGRQLHHHRPAAAAAAGRAQVARSDRRHEPRRSRRASSAGRSPIRARRSSTATG